jgi:tripartite-type tricarboxylate transporter receptor subunit TctC
MEEAGIDFNYVPTGGSPKVMAALAGGHIDTGFMWLSVADSYIKTGEMRGLVVFAPKRLKDYPDVPTLKEKGIDLTFSGYYGIGTPKGTPANVVKILEEKFTKAFNNPDCQKEFTDKKLELMFLDSTGFSKFLDEMYEKVNKALKIMAAKK